MCANRMISDPRYLTFPDILAPVLLSLSVSPLTAPSSLAPSFARTHAAVIIDTMEATHFTRHNRADCPSQHREEVATAALHPLHHSDSPFTPSAVTVARSETTVCSCLFISVCIVQVLRRAGGQSLRGEWSAPY